MKIHIHYPIKTGPWGGGNQFLKALKLYLESTGQYSDTWEGAKVVLTNSHHDLLAAAKNCLRYPKIPIVHRLDGVFETQRQGGHRLDAFIFHFCRLFASGLVFQSDWSRRRLAASGFNYELTHRIIHNAVDKEIFFPASQIPGGKIRIVITVWAGNPKKGFDYYEFLDQNLDFEKFEVVLVGQSPVKFRNIQYISPLPQDQLAGILRNSHIYLTCSQDDACSNSLLEAKACGLPVAALDSGGHPEIVSGPDMLFKDKAGMIAALDQLATYRRVNVGNDRTLAISQVAKQYIEFLESVPVKAPSNVLEFLLLRIEAAALGLSERARYHWLRWKNR